MPYYNNNYINSFNTNNINYWNQMIFMIHEMNLNEMIVPVHNREYLLGFIEAEAAASESSCACVKTPVEIFEKMKISVTIEDKVQGKKNDCCSVCQEDYAEKDEVVTTGCKHSFHALCLATWVKKNTTCPTCRETVVKLVLEPDYKPEPEEPKHNDSHKDKIGLSGEFGLPRDEDESGE